MVLAEYKPTRSQLLQLRRTRRTAERGHRLLKLKRDALIVEFFRVLERAKTLRSHLADKYRVAEQRLAIARAIEGSIGVRSAALASKEVPTLQLKTKNVMGIIVPKIDAKSVRKKLEQRGDVMERLVVAWQDPTRRAMILRRLWLVSTGFTIFGFVVMLYLISKSH